MLTIDPPPAVHIAWPKTWVALKTPATLTSSVRMNDASPASPGGASIPALLTRTEGVPIWSRTPASAARSVTSAWMIPSPPSRTSIPYTVAPSLASVEVQTGPRFPSAPVTTATRPFRPSAAIIAALLRAGVLQVRGSRPRGGEQLLEVLARQLRVLCERVAQDAADDVVQLVRRQPVAWRLEREILAAEHVAGGERRRRDDLLAHLRDRVDLA